MRLGSMDRVRRAVTMFVIGVRVVDDGDAVRAVR
jgi:hypothetical protein